MNTKKKIVLVILIIAGIGIILMANSSFWPREIRVTAGPAGLILLLLLELQLYRGYKAAKWNFTKLQYRFLLANLIIASVGTVGLFFLGIWRPTDYEILGGLAYGLIFLLSVDLWGNKVRSE